MSPQCSTSSHPHRLCDILQGETPQEMAGLAEAMQLKAVPVHTSCDGTSHFVLQHTCIQCLSTCCISCTNYHSLHHSPPQSDVTAGMQKGFCVTSLSHHWQPPLDQVVVSHRAIRDICKAFPVDLCLFHRLTRSCHLQCWTLWGLEGMELGQ